MGLRPARCYRRLERPYTRLAVRVPDKNYIGGVPPVRIRKFVTGNPSVDADAVFYLVAKDALQIRDNALEAARMAINRYLEKKLTDKGYLLRLRVFPHHVLRENKQLTGAGADRMQRGMSQAFGKPIGRAAQVRPGTIIFEVRTKRANEPVVREAFRRAVMKLPGHYRVVVEALAQATA